MAGWFVLLYLLVIAGLVGVAIYEHQTATSLFLPVSPALTILTILLPVLSLLNTVFYHRSNSPSSNSQPHLSLPPPSSPSAQAPITKCNSNTPSKLTLPSTLQLLQALLTVYLLSTFLSSSSSGNIPLLTDCVLSTQWKSLWTSHNAQAIRQIQDTLSCCGFRTVKDMAWPFPTGSPNDGAKHVDCVAKYGRHTPCLGAWEAELSSITRGEVSVLVITGLVQLAGWYFAGRVKLNGRAGTGNTTSVLALLKNIWRRLLGGSSRQDEEPWNNGTERRGTGSGNRNRNRNRNGTASHRTRSRMLVGSGEVERLVDEVDDDDQQEDTEERDMGRDLERGSNYGATGGNVWRSG
ncbi:hypothetical protein V8F20_002760 [Naviculisporaceae sp. PSN 640]